MSSNIPMAPQGPMPAIGIPNSQDYPRLVYSAPYFLEVPLAELIEPSVIEAVENQLPSLVPPYVDAAAQAAVQQLAVLLTGSTMSGPLFLSPLMPTQPSQAATMAYVDSMIATAGIPEVPAVPSGQVWAREVGQWVPITPQTGVFLPLSGGSMTGNINMSGNTITNMTAVPAMPNGAAPAQWVLNQIASVSLYQGTWNADTNTPDLTQLSTHVNAYTWIALTSSPSGVVIGPAIPGLQGMTVFNGDTVIYSTVQGAFQAIHAGGITLPEADGRYVQLAGSQMSGALLLNANASQPLQAVTYQQLEAFVPPGAVGEAPNDGQLYGRNGLTASWAPVLPLAGGILTGALTLSGNATGNLNPVPLQQMTTAISAATAGLLPLAGGQMTGLMSLSGNATVNLNPVPLQQVNSMLNGALAGYLPLSGGGTITSGDVNFVPPVSTYGVSNVTWNLTNSGGTAWHYTQAGTAAQFYNTASNFGLAVYASGTAGAVAAASTGIFGFSSNGNFSSGGNITAGTALQCGGPSGPYFQDVSGAMTCVGNCQVNGNLGVTGNIQTTNVTITANYYGPTSFYVLAAGTSVLNIAANGIFPATNNTMNCGAPGNAWFQVAAYNFPNESDPRNKKDMQPASDGALNTVKAIPVYNFIYASDPTEKLVTGFDATEVQQHHAHAVMTGEDEDKTLAINLPDMIAVLWQAVQELSAEVAALK